MSYKIRVKQTITFLIMVGVLSLITFWMVTSNKQKFSEDRMANKELKEFHSLFEDGEPAYSLEQANNIAKGLIPLIEKTVGKKFKQKPEIRLITTDGLEKLLVQKSKINRIFNNSGTSTDDIKKTTRILSKALLGLYDRAGQIVYLLPQRIPVTMKLLKLDGKYSLDISKMIIAHELTHALQDQHMNFENCYNKIPGNDELYAFRSTIEGHATFIEKKIGKQLGIDDFIISLSPLADSGKIVFNSPVLNQMMKSSRGNDPLHSFMTAYTDGEDFINYNFEKGGNTLLWKILEFPPVDSAMIVYPEIYLEKKYDILNYKNILDNIYDFNSINKYWEFYYQNYSMNKLDFRQYLEGFDLSKKKFFFSKISHIQLLLVLNKDKNNAVAEVDFFIMKDQQYAIEMVALLEEVYTNILKTTILQDIQPWTDMHVLKEFENSIEIARQTSATNNVIINGNKTIQLKTKNFILVKDNMLVVISDGVFDFFPYSIEKIATAIFTRYKNAKIKEMQI